MSKYTIISKSGRGNIRGNVYTITYQVDLEPGRYETQLYCLGSDEARKGKFCWIEGKERPYIENKKDQDEFLDQLKAYQNGSSYRKSHPIRKTQVELLQDLKQDYLLKISDIDMSINKLKEEELKSKVKDYIENIDKKSLNEFLSRFDSLFTNNSRYILFPDTFSINQNIFIYDVELGKVVKVYEMHKNNILCRDLRESEVKRLLR